MSLQAAIDTLSKEIEALQKIIPADRPQDELEAFCLLRAKALGRTMLISAQNSRASTVSRLDSYYKGARGKMTSEGQLK